MILSPKMTKWCLFGMFFLFMPSIYYMIVALALLTPIHMVTFMFTDKIFFFLSLMNLAVYLPVYYGLSVFLANLLFKVSQVQARQTIIVMLLLSICVGGFLPDYGQFKRHRRLSDHPTWLQTFLQNKDDKPGIEMYVLPNRIIAPGQVTVGVRANSFPKGDRLYAWDLDGDGESEFQLPHKHEVEHTYQHPGVFYPRVQVTDSDGTTHRATFEIYVLDRVELESQLNMQWKALWSVLGNRDEETLKLYTTEHFLKKYRSGFWGNSFLTEKTAVRYSAPLFIVENYQEDSTKLVIVLHSTIQSPNTTHQTPVEVRFEYDPDPYDYDNANPYRIFEYRELPDDYTLESYLSSQWSYMIQALEEEDIKGATTYFSQSKQKIFQKFWTSKENIYLTQAHLLRAPLNLVKMETGKLTLQGAAPLEESGSSSKIRVEFVREYENPNRISSFEILLNNEQLELELNSVWTGMWNALTQKYNWNTNNYIHLNNRSMDFFYLSHDEGQFLTPTQWIQQKVDWTKLAKHFQVPLTLVERCDNHISLVHVFSSEPENHDSNYLEVNFSKEHFGPWKVEQYHLYRQALPSSLANALKNETKGKDFDWCIQKEEVETKNIQSLSD